MAAFSPGPVVSVQYRFAAIAEDEALVPSPEVHIMSEGSDTESCRETAQVNSARPTCGFRDSKSGPSAVMVTHERAFDMAAAGGEDRTPVLEWLKSLLSQTTEVLEFDEGNAGLYENFEQAYHDKKEAEDIFDREFNSLIGRVASYKSRCTGATVALDRAERDLNEGLGLIKSQFTEVTTSVLALSQGNQARGSNEHAYFEQALNILDTLLLRCTQEIRGN